VLTSLSTASNGAEREKNDKVRVFVYSLQFCKQFTITQPFLSFSLCSTRNGVGKMDSKSRMGEDERAAFAGLSVSELQEIEAATAKRLKAINDELRSRGYICSSASHRLDYQLAMDFMEKMRPYTLTPGDKFGILGWMNHLLQKEIQQQAALEARDRVLDDAMARLRQMNKAMGGSE
jgi:hypothetical protein